MLSCFIGLVGFVCILLCVLKLQFVHGCQKVVRIFKFGGEPRPGLREVIESLPGLNVSRFFREKYAIERVLTALFGITGHGVWPPVATPFPVAET
jgi:hypothetical protein